MTNGAKRRLYRFYAFLVYLTPMLVLFFVRIEKYTQTAGAISFFGFIVIAFVVLFFKKQLLTFAEKDVLLSLAIVLLIFSIAAIFIAKELAWIAGTSIVGAILSKVVNIVGDVYENYEYKIVDGIKKKNRDPALPDKEAWREAYGA